MPPRHGKSELISKYFPAWFLGAFPDKRIILASYASDFAAQWGRKARDVVEEYGKDVFGIQVRKDSKAADSWNLLRALGGMDTAGLLSGITGKGADLFVVDDPVKNAQEASSPLIRERIWEEFQSTVYTRLHPGASIVIVMTRWNEDDLVGRLLQQQPDEWKVIRLPAIAEENDQLHREVGEALWPDRYDLKALEKIRKTIGSYFWSALYQQRPAPKEGAIYKATSFRYFLEDQGKYLLLNRQKDVMRHYLQEQCGQFMTADTALSTRQSADYTVIGVWAQGHNKELLLLDRVRKRMQAPDTVEAMMALRQKWPRTSYIGVEKSTAGLGVIQLARQKGLAIKELEVDRDHIARAHLAAARMEGGDVYFRQDAPYLEELETELLSVPFGEHDDQSDMVAYAVQANMQYGLGTLPYAAESQGQSLLGSAVVDRLVFGRIF